MNGTWLDFEKPIIELERKIEDLKSRSPGETAETSEEISRLERKADRLRHDIFSKLTRWQRVKLARHPRRPYTLDYLKHIAPQFLELHGDRRFRDDPAIVGGLAVLDDMPLVLIGHQKGRDTKENIHRNFGMAHPEGYRKALRLMRLAANYGCPVVTFVDTPGGVSGTRRRGARAVRGARAEHPRDGAPPRPDRDRWSSAKGARGERSRSRSATW